MRNKIRCYYRLCDKSRFSSKYSWKTCLLNFITNFKPEPQELKILIDNCDKETIEFVIDLCNKNKYSYAITNDGNAFGFYTTVLDALNNTLNTIIYFVEADYLHVKNSKNALHDIFNHFGKDNYVTLYDNPDKYYPYFWNTNINMHLRGYCEVEELKTFRSKIHYLKSGWWRTTSNTCFTFACELKTLKEDLNIMIDCSKKYKDTKPNDYEMCKNLLAKGREIYSPIPSYAAHTVLLPTGVDWQKI